MTIERFHALDAVRAFALLSGIALHASMTFMPGLASFGFPADTSQSPTLQIVFYVIHIFRMMLFFVIAGFFSHLIFHRKGIFEFLQDRGKRILVPFIVGWLFFGPLAMVLVYIALAPATDGASGPPTPDGFPLAHLWFLYYLMLIYAVVLAIRSVFIRYLDSRGNLRTYLDAGLRAAVNTYAAPLLLSVPVAACLYLTPNWIMWSGIASPDTGLLPQRAAIGCFGTAFIFGWLLHRQNALLSVWSGRWMFHLALAAAFTALCFWLVQRETNPMAVAPLNKLVYAASYAFAIWNWIFGIIGLAMRHFSKENKVRRYIADASYWMYLAHLPVVFALQLVVLDWPLHWGIKFPLIIVVATALLLLSYHYLVRNTYVGEILNGRKNRRELKSRSTLVTAVDEQQIIPKPSSVVAELVNVYKRHGEIPALNGLDLQIHVGELLALLGPNGAGKSTTISCLLGLQNPDSGEVSVFGQSPHAIEARRKCGAMLQDVDLPPELRVRELIDLSCSYYASPMSVEEVLHLTHTTAIAKRPYQRLSGGQKRLVQFAIALCGRPKLLFLDEPTVGLDHQSRQLLWARLRELVSEGCSIVLTTHYLEEAEALADRVAVIAKGKVIALGTVNEVRARVAHVPITCVTQLTAKLVAQWPGVLSVSREGGRLHLTTSNADEIARRLMMEDPNFRELEIGRAGLAEAFTEITQEVA